MKLYKALASVLCATLFVSTPVILRAQFAGTSAPNSINAAALPKPPTGSKVAIVVFEDLGCPACARAHPIEQSAAEKAHVALLRYDFPIPAHVWTFDGAVCARYIQDKINPDLASEYRSAVFASQRSIETKDDLQVFTQNWLQRHGQRLPFVLDPDGSLTKKVQADYDLGLRVNVRYTPTVVVVTRDKYQVVCGTATGSDDPNQILSVAEAAVAQTSLQTIQQQARKHSTK